ncbi:MAG: glycosyl hydrolase-related protein [bacterium]
MNPKEIVEPPILSETRLLGIHMPPVWLSEEGGNMQPLTAVLWYAGEDKEATLSLDGGAPVKVPLKQGEQSFALKVAAAEQPRTVALRLATWSKVLADVQLAIAPPRIRDMWVLPHSHVDIGYTHRQAEVLDLQVQNLETAIRLAEASSSNPPGLRFKWNPEAVWALDHYLRRATPEQHEAFLRAARRGDVEVNALYANMLTGLCRPEELAQCLADGVRIAGLTGVPLETAAMCDIPGCAWGLVPLLAQAGVKYFAAGPNMADRVGHIHVWDDKPFYWKSQSGEERVLCWVVDNYHRKENLEQAVINQVAQLERNGFPYDAAFIFWVASWPNGGVDNAPPDGQLVDKVSDWNAKYAVPKVHIGLAREFFRAFEARHGASLPEFAGDLTPYWEDGAGSTARETALSRGSAERLAQAEALYAMSAPMAHPAAAFAAAWNSVLLYGEHTWGAWCSVLQPEAPLTLDQWQVKRGFAEEAERQSRALLSAALPLVAPTPAIDVYNTTQWERTDLARVPPGLGGQSVLDERGQPVACQRLGSGELVFLAQHVPPFGTKRYQLSDLPPPAIGAARASGLTLRTTLLNVEVDQASGAVRSLRLAGGAHDYVDQAAPVALNDYRYVLGTDTANALGNGPVRVTVVENGPLVASLRIESEAPGCNRLVRDVRVVDGLDRVEMINQVDRKPVRDKDAVHFGFGFHVPGGTVRMETPWAVVRPTEDQLPGACCNWFTVQRWVDVSNSERGVTWAPVDTPLMEIGGLTANLVGGVGFGEWQTVPPEAYMTEALASQTIYSWAQNNHWNTNYKTDQPGLSTLRYAVRPHEGGYAAAAAARFGHETTRPLLVAAASDRAPGSLLSVSPPEVLVETLKVSADGKALIVRLFGVSGQPQTATLAWQSIKPAAVWLTDLTERPLTAVSGAIRVPAYGVVHLRADLP